MEPSGRAVRPARIGTSQLRSCGWFETTEYSIGARARSTTRQSRQYCPSAGPTISKPVTVRRDHNARAQAKLRVLRQGSAARGR